MQWHGRDVVCARGGKPGLERGKGCTDGRYGREGGKVVRRARRQGGGVAREGDLSSGGGVREGGRTGGERRKMTGGGG